MTNNDENVASARNVAHALRQLQLERHAELAPDDQPLQCVFSRADVNDEDLATARSQMRVALSALSHIADRHDTLRRVEQNVREQHVFCTSQNDITRQMAEVMDMPCHKLQSEMEALNALAPNICMPANFHAYMSQVASSISQLTTDAVDLPVLTADAEAIPSTALPNAALDAVKRMLALRRSVNALVETVALSTIENALRREHQGLTRDTMKQFVALLTDHDCSESSATPEAEDARQGALA